jgi:hypothetical protein
MQIREAQFVRIGDLPRRGIIIHYNIRVKAGRRAQLDYNTFPHAP